MPVAFAFNESHAAHRASGHVERPERLSRILDLLAKAPVRRHLIHPHVERAALDVLHLVHEPRYVEHVVAAVHKGYDRLNPDTYLTAGSLAAALDAVGALLAVTEAVLDRRATTGFAAVRPPGHHATPERSMGFCLFSNVAVAARWAQQVGGLERALIVDFDVHHGNGTQDIFYEDPSVMYMSIHQSPFYPGTGQANERGAGAAVGTTVNLPLPSGARDAHYERLFATVLRPIALKFAPELILVSAGYDAHWKDLLGGMRMTVRGYAALIRELRYWADSCCDGRIVGALEGGYHIDALAHSVLSTLSVLHDVDSDIADPIGNAPGEAPDLDAYVEDLEISFGVNQEGD